MVMRQVDSELLGLGVDAKPRRHAADEGVETVRSNPATDVRQRVVEERLEAFPLCGERGLPVRLEQVGETADELTRVRECQGREVGIGTDEARSADDQPLNLLILENRRILRPAVVVQGTGEVK